MKSPLMTFESQLVTHNGQSMDTDCRDFLCVCGKGFSTERGMKIHRTKRGCLNTCQSEQQRPASADKTSEDQSQDADHSATDIHALTSGEVFAQTLDAKRDRLNLPPANARDEWRSWTSDLSQSLTA